MLNRTEYTQPALLAAGVAVWRAWQQRGGAQPALLAGHSLGEYTALVAAGALSLHDGAHLVRLRGQLMQDAAPAGTGAMAAVLGAEDALVQEVCEAASGDEVVVPANYNSPGQIVIGGHAAAVDSALALLGRARRAQDGEARGQRAFAHAADARSRQPPGRSDGAAWRGTRRRCRWCRTSTPQSHDGVDAIRDALVRQLYLPVQWTGCVQALAAHGRRRASPNAARARCWPAWSSASTRSLDARAIGTPGEFEAAIEEWKQGMSEQTA